MTKQMTGSGRSYNPVANRLTPGVLLSLSIRIADVEGVQAGILQLEYQAYRLAY